ncbi:uncharacterized protein [Linepithema humile]|uniref:uncharacterized protein n=1 Tax=Linepithema humile TaxID=83485 RepID=UPI00351E756B
MKQSSSISETLLKNKHSMIIQKDEIFANDDSNHKTSASISGQYTLSKGISHTVPLVANEETSLSSTSSYRSQTPVSERSDLVSPPLSCFSGNQQRVFKKRKFDPVETAFHQMNHTLSTMAAEVCSQKKAVNDDTDVLIGKLVTAELQAAIELRKSELKQKFMKLLYF